MPSKIEPHMKDKGLYFVKGHPRPAVAPHGAPFIRRHPDGTPMRAASSSDTLVACEARFNKGAGRRDADSPSPAAAEHEGASPPAAAEPAHNHRTVSMPTRGKRG